MNILLVTTHFNTGGITTYIMTLSKELISHGHKVCVVSSGGNMVAFLESLGAVHHTINIQTKSILSWKLYAAVPRLKKIVYDQQIDIIHAQTRVTQFLAFMIKAVPYVSTCHGFFRPRMLRLMFSFWGKRVIAISQQVRRHLENDFFVEADRIITVRNGIDLEQFKARTFGEREQRRNELGYQNEFVIGIIARLSDVKGHAVLIDAFAKVRKQLLSVKLVVVGKGKEEDSLKERVKKLGLERDVDFIPAVDCTMDLLTVFDCFVLPSLQEGLGLSVMEAQAAGLAVIASRVGGIPSLIENGKTGILVAPGDPDQLSQAIIELLKDPEKIKLLGHQARLKAEHEYGSAQMAREIVKIYQEVVLV